MSDSVGGEGARAGIGATLADARWQAHLTVEEVSQRTRIREAIIWGIEQDDFSACGGDAYARGHIRAIAQAVGTDPDPLIREYDQKYRRPEDIEDVVALRPSSPRSASTAPARSASRASARPARTPAEAMAPPMTPSPGRAPRSHRRRRLAVSAALAVVVLGIVGWAAYHVASGTSPAPHGRAVAGAAHPASSPAGGVAANGQGSPQPSPAPSLSPTSSPSPVPSPASPHSTPPAPPSRALTLAAAVPFGPGGEGTGDNPQAAAAAIDSHTSTAWKSDWYTSPALGNLKPGTGLLIELGRRYTVTDAEVDLGGFYGADVQLRAGNEASLSGLPEVASARGAGGTVHFILKQPARARYVLIWFTQLPPDGHGTYQAAVYHVIIRGRP